MTKKTFLLDSHAIIAYLEDEPSAQKVEELLRNNATLYMCSINLGEVYYILLRENGQVQAENALKNIIESDIELIEADWPLVKKAAEIKSKGKISYADCFAIAAANKVGAWVVTGDPEFKIAEKEKIARIEWL